MKIKCSLLLLALVFCGCKPPEGQEAPPSPAPPVRDCCPGGQCPPPADVPVSLRSENDDGLPYVRNDGSCFWRAYADSMVSQDKAELVPQWNARHLGGANVVDVGRAAGGSGHRTESTTSGDVAFLERCSRERRAAAILYDEPWTSGIGGHAVTFNGFVGGHAVLTNNNRPQKYWRVERSKFLATWRMCGGDAIAMVGQPMMPPVW